jgi:AcrR family transcriptional regulator
MPIEVRREQVLDAALRLIDREGYAAATMEAIARESDLAKPVVYNAYPGRAKLLFALLDREEAKGRQALAESMAEAAATGEQDPRALLLLWTERMLEKILADPVAWRLMIARRGAAPREVLTRIADAREVARRQVETMLATYITAHGRQTGADLELASELILAALEHAATLLLEDPQRYPPQRLSNLLRATLSALPA